LHVPSASVKRLPIPVLPLLRTRLEPLSS